jgi:hypothetical protein
MQAMASGLRHDTSMRAANPSHQLARLASGRSSAGLRRKIRSPNRTKVLSSEKTGKRLIQTAADLLEDLLLKVLRHHPQEHITMDGVIGHP